MTSRRWRGWSEGDLWTVGIGLGLAMLLALTSIPAVLEKRDASSPRSAATPVMPPPVDVPASPGPIAAPAQVPPPSPQSLLGPLAPEAIPRPPLARSTPYAEPSPTTAAVPTLAAGAVRVLATLPAVGPPGAVAVAPDGTVSVGTDAPASPSAAAKLLRWNALGALQQTADVPEQPAARTRGVTALDQLADGSLIAADAATARVLKFDPATASWSVLARLPDLVTCVLPTATPCQPGLEDTSPLPRGMVIDQAGATFIADAGQGTIWRLAPGKPIEVWYQSADIAGDNGVAGLAFDADGHLLVAVTSVADVMGPGAGALLRIERAANGSAGTRTVVTAFKAGEDPVDIAVGASGNLYVPLRGADALVVLDRQGVESLRVVEDALKGPTAVDIVLGRVLVTATGPRAAVLEVGVVDRPARRSA